MSTVSITNTGNSQAFVELKDGTSYFLRRGNKVSVIEEDIKRVSGKVKKVVKQEKTLRKTLPKQSTQKASSKQSSKTESPES